MGGGRGVEGGGGGVVKGKIVTRCHLIDKYPLSSKLECQFYVLDINHSVGFRIGLLNPVCLNRRVTWMKDDVSEREGAEEGMHSIFDKH